MKLNADILFDFLNPGIPLTRYGTGNMTLHLSRPEFFSGDSNCFEANHLYISLADRLPDNPRFSENVVIICVGGFPPAWYMEGRCCCLVVKGSVDLYSVFNQVQFLYNCFDSWDKKLNNIVGNNADINEIVKKSFKLIGLPMVVLDGKFRHIASNPPLLINSQKDDGTIDLDGFAKAMEQTKIDMTTRVPFIMKVEPEALCRNLFNQQKTYIGSITLHSVKRNFRSSDYVLLDHLAKYVEQALLKLPEMDDDRHRNLKSTFSDLLQSIPSNPKRLRILDNYKKHSRFICLKFIPQGKMRSAPLEFLSGMVESSIPNSVALIYETNVVAYVEIEESMDSFFKVIRDFVNKMDLLLGISEPFTDLMLARFYYRQASVALEHGQMLSPNESILMFSDYRLYYLLSHSTGEFPLEILIPQGIKKIYERDQQTGTGYMQTLKTYLKNNMNVSKTASELFLHRSSLVDRLKRIEKYLDVDLEDPDQRLMVQILLKISEFNERLKDLGSN